MKTYPQTRPAPDLAAMSADTTATSGFSVTDSAAARIAHLIATEPGASAFRVAVNGGGCSGFQYEFGFAEAPAADDTVIRRGAATVVVDEVSLPFLDNAEIDWVDDLIGSSFKIRNPNAKSSCGCGVSFSV
jgi:iron-sulfur cluster assembly accessory protein